MARTLVLPGATGAIHVALISTPTNPTQGGVSAATPHALEELPPAVDRGKITKPSTIFVWQPFRLSQLEGIVVVKQIRLE
jgi:hypothetical protein